MEQRYSPDLMSKLSEICGDFFVENEVTADEAYRMFMMMAISSWQDATDVRHMKSTIKLAEARKEAAEKAALIPTIKIQEH